MEIEEEDTIVRNIKALGVDEPRRNNEYQKKPLRYNKADAVDIIDPYDFGGFPEPPNDRIEIEYNTGKWAGSYPTVPKSRHSPTSFISTPIPPPPKHSYSIYDPAPPILPPKILERSVQPSIPDPRDIPVILPPKPPKYIPEVKYEKKEYSFASAAALESGEPLRTLFLPATLRKTFLNIAQPNTSANLETCGILCGTLIQNALFVSRLVIPEQEATSDTCNTTDEMGLFEYCDKEDLMVFGWIHTHPSQTCFMSSVDLHTHVGYQLMLKESIAIVCAPSRSPS